MANRECGNCSLCCKLLGITELDKPTNKWCHNAKIPGGGCKIYENRPNSCQLFECGWLINPTFGDHWNPTRSKMVISFNADSNDHVLQIWVDQSNRYGFEKEPYRSDIQKLARDGIGKYRTEVRLPDGGIKVING